MIVAFLLALELALPATQASPSPAVVTLQQVIEQARTGSPFRASARAIADGTALAAGLAGRRLNPLFELRGENWGGDPSLPLDVFAVATQTVELGGKRAARMAVAGAQRDLAAAQLTLTEQQVVQRAAQLYVQALRLRGVLGLHRANRQGLDDLISAVARRVDEGHSAEADLLRFRTEAARLDIEITKASLDLERGLAMLTMFVGASQSYTAAQLVEPPSLTPPALNAAVVAQAVARHPEVGATQARLDTTRQAVRLEQARRIPDPMVTGGYKRTAGFSTGVLAVTMNLPLFDRNGAAIARLVGEQGGAAAEHAAAAVRLTTEITIAIATARALAAQRDRADTELIGPAETVRTAARATFREGTTDVLKLIDAERVYADVQRTALELRLDALTAALDVRIALGEEVVR